MQFIKRVASLVSIIVLSAGLFQLPVLAQEQKGSSGLNISPTRAELQVEPGKSDTIHLSIQNVSGTDIEAKVTINDFESDGITGEPKLLPDSQQDSPTSIRKFITNATNFPMVKEEKKNVDLGVNIPVGTAPGAYYGVIRYTAVPLNQKNDQGNVALTASVGTLVLIEVPGNITEQIQINSMKVSQGDKTGTFFTKSPTQVAIEIKNNGNGFSKPFGRVSVSGGIGGGEVYSYELNNTDPKANILPASTRTFKDAIHNVSRPGRYTVLANISYGRGGEVITQSVSFWYIPVWLLAVIAAVIVLIVLGGVIIYRKKFAHPKKRKK